MFIANMAWHQDQPGGEGKWHRIGKLWFDAEHHHASILLHGFRPGKFVAKVFRDLPLTPPYLDGDIQVETGEYSTEGAGMTKQYLWCGHIHTSNDHRGTIYTGVLEVDPTISILTKKDGRSGGFLSVHLSDHGRDGRPDDDLPF